MAIFKDVPIGTEFMSNGLRYRKCSEKKAHLMDNARDGAGPLRFRPETEVTEPPSPAELANAASADAAKAEQAKKEHPAKAEHKPKTEVNEPPKK